MFKTNSIEVNLFEPIYLTQHYKTFMIQYIILVSVRVSKIKYLLDTNTI
jgi:hypothetical protein